MNTLKIKDLCVEIENKKILNGLNLEIKTGEIHAIMGPMVQVNQLYQK